MKKFFILPTMLVAMAMFSCKERAYIDNPGSNDYNQDSIPVVKDPDPTPDPEGVKVPEGTINVYQALDIAKSLASGAVSEETYFIKGWVSSFDATQRGKADFEDKFKQYGNDYAYISARNDGLSTKSFYCYRILGKNGAAFPDHDALMIGDFVVVKCKITNYNGIYESSGTCATYSSSNAHFNEVFPPFPGCPEPGPGEISVNQAIAISDSIGSGKTTAETYKIRGVVTGIGSTESDVSQYGNMTFYLSSDGDNVATCYRLKYKSSTGRFTKLEQVQVNDTVLVEAKIQNYNGVCEPTSGFVSESTNPNF